MIDVLNQIQLYKFETLTVKLSQIIYTFQQKY